MIPETERLKVTYRWPKKAKVVYMSDSNELPNQVLFSEWLTKFSEDKELVGASDQSDAFAVHSIKRYIDKTGGLWEVAQTYTGRVVTREGQTSQDQLAVTWTEWETLHQVLIVTKPDSIS